jgi:primosomal replication protein N
VNTLVIAGTVLKLEPLRYTPAGLPLLSFLLAHVSEVTEAGLNRKVQCQLPAMLMGDLAKTPLAEGANIQAKGFLAQRSAKSTQLVMHIQQIQIV